MKFQLFEESAAVILQSTSTVAYSFLSFTPATPTTFAELTNLTAVYTFTIGNCHGGALRWSVRVSSTQSIFIYYGAWPNFTDCVGANSQSGVNILSRSDARFDLSQLGGPWYGTYADALTIAGSMTIIRASLVMDGGWAGDQVAPLASATVNDNTFVSPAETSLARICDLSAAGIAVQRLSPATIAVSEAASIQPADIDGQFRIVDCQYIYNLDVKTLDGAGTYKVEVVIDSAVIPASPVDPQTFSLKQATVKPPPGPLEGGPAFGSPDCFVRCRAGRGTLTAIAGAPVPRAENVTGNHYPDRRGGAGYRRPRARQAGTAAQRARRVARP